MTLSVHLCLQHVCRDAASRTGSLSSPTDWEARETKQTSARTRLPNDDFATVGLIIRSRLLRKNFTAFPYFSEQVWERHVWIRRIGVKEAGCGRGVLQPNGEFLGSGCLYSLRNFLNFLFRNGVFWYVSVQCWLCRKVHYGVQRPITPVLCFQGQPDARQSGILFWDFARGRTN